MKHLNRSALISSLIGFSLTMLVAPHHALAWGVTGHHYISRLAIASLPAELKPLYTQNGEWIVRHSVDPDLWRNRDRSEGPNHFIDLDTFGSDVATNFPQDYWLACGLFGKAEVDKNGLVPWRIGQFYGKLVRAFKAKKTKDIVEISAFLAHYVEDVHVPFHAAANYDGQLTNQKGIHARFESVLVEKQIKFEDLKSQTLIPISHPVQLAFDWAKESLRLTAPILDGDKAAVAKDASYGDSYYEAFGTTARPIALRRLEEGGKHLASIWYAAWQEAGKPELPMPSDAHAGEPIDKPTHDPDKNSDEKAQ